MWHRALLLIVAATISAAPVQGQQWNDARTRELVTRALQRRSRQLADTTLADYRATARGYLTFLAQLGEGLFLPPKVVRADQLELEVYWKAPNFSKQWIVGRRDTLLLPTDISYHRDHLGIVQNNFPDIIRLGDGDEVRDVPHPLSAPGLVAYDFAIDDSLRLGIPGRTIEVYEVKVRPRDDRTAAAVGALYVARDDAQVVRMAFSFTRAALRDPQLEDVSVILENSLIEDRWWLPRRQEIEIRRSGSWMDFPVKGIIRGRWEIRDYTVNAGGTVATAPGPEIMLAPPARRARHQFPATAILDSLPDEVSVASDADVRLVQEEARRLVRAQALARSRSTRPSARAISDLAQVNRIEGLAVGVGIRRRLGAGLDATVAGRLGIADEAAKGTASLGWTRADGLSLRLSVHADFRDAVDDPETSRVRNTIAAQEFGSDATRYFGARGGALALGGQVANLWRWSVEGRSERQRPLQVHAVPSSGHYPPALAAAVGRSSALIARLDRPNAAWMGRSLLRAKGELRVGQFVPETPDSSLGRTTLLRGYGSMEVQVPAGHTVFAARLAGGGVSGSDGVPRQEWLLAGGPISAPGYAPGSLVATGVTSARVELRRTVPFLPLSLGRWGRVPGSLTLAPFVGGVVLGGTTDGRKGAFPFAGLGAITLFDVLRVDVARGLRNGRWRLEIDASRDFWSIL